ncbi:hypothetical protein BO86DRAFT_31119 [Aspergillus japonicus CBS 114.51]|nr:hypothetical protein BO86DRAFT_31119 [Aspergillus japonicus CBS 114.51]RAH83656.1 hypothetical protein BO86DRAFT_31119 [Aspergillus japonicus CBS 114.51]
MTGDRRSRMFVVPQSCFFSLRERHRQPSRRVLEIESLRQSSRSIELVNTATSAELPVTLSRQTPNSSPPIPKAALLILVKSDLSLFNVVLLLSARPSRFSQLSSQRLRTGCLCSPNQKDYRHNQSTPPPEFFLLKVYRFSFCVPSYLIAHAMFHHLHPRRPPSLPRAMRGIGLTLR